MDRENSVNDEQGEGGVGTSPHRAMPATGSEQTPAGNFEDTCHSNDDGDVMRSSSTSALPLSGARVNMFDRASFSSFSSVLSVFVIVIVYRKKFDQTKRERMTQPSSEQQHLPKDMTNDDIELLQRLEEANR